MKIVSILISLLLCSPISFGQWFTIIKRTDAFFVLHQPGMIPVDAEGNALSSGPDTINTVYVETSNNNIKWIGAWKNGKSFSILATEIKDSTFEVGTGKDSDQKIILKPARGNHLWQLQLIPERTGSKAPVKAKRGELILKSKYKRNTIIQQIKSQIELASLPSV